MFTDEFIFDLQRFKEISNDKSNTVISGTSGEDSIQNYGEKVTIGSGAGNDSIYNYYADKASIDVGAGNDYIYLTYSSKVTIYAGDGNDTIYTFNWSGSDGCSINGGNGDDEIYTPGDKTTVEGGAGNDYIHNYDSNNVTIDAGAGNDSIDAYGVNTSVKAGKGNDTINSGGTGVVLIYNSGDGNDVINGFNEDDTVYITGGTWSTTRSGENVIVTVGNGKITLMGAASLSAVNITSSKSDIHRINVIKNTESNTLLSGTSGRDSIDNEAGNVTISTGDGKDTVYGRGDSVTVDTGNDDDYIHYWRAVSNVSINSGKGNDTIDNYRGENISSSNITINGGSGNDLIMSNVPNTSILGGTGNDTINAADDEDEGYHSSFNVTMDGGDDNDSVAVGGINNFVKGGKGNDKISISGVGLVCVYNSGDGNDFINGFNEDDTLYIPKGTWSTTKSGNDVIIKVGSGKMTLVGAASLSAVNIVSAESDIHFGEIIRAEQSNTLITGTKYNDSIGCDYSNVTVNAGAGNDLIYNGYGGESNIINAGADNDSIYNDNASKVTINAGTGNDTVINEYYSSKVSIDAGAGNDYIYNGEYCSDVTIKAGDGNDTIYNSDDEDSTIEGGKGNDSIKLNAYSSGKNLILYNDGDGKDVILGFNDISTLRIGSGTGTYSTQVSGNDVIVKVGSGSINLKNVFATASKLNINGNKITLEEHNLFKLSDSGEEIENIKDNVTIAGGKGNDLIDNYGNNLSISAGDGNDTICSEGKYDGSYVTIDGGTGNDLIQNIWSQYVTLIGGAGNDSIYNEASNVSIDGGSGNDIINNKYGHYCIINTGAGNDSVYNYAGSVTINTGSGNDTIIADSNYDDVTLNGGTGNDLISLSSELKNVLIQYKTGDGNDSVVGFNGDDTLLIGSGAGTYSTQTSGEDIIVTVGDGKISLIGAASLSAVNIFGEETSEPSPEENSWTISGTTAKYGTSGNTLITVKGVKNTDGLSLSGNVVTVSKDSLNKKKVTISGDGYTLALADGLTPTTKKAAWSYKNGTATYKSSYKTAGYTLASNSKSITYSAATTAETLATVKGVKSKDGLSVSGKVVTVSEASVNAKKITISGNGYTLKLADGLTPATKKAAWSYKNGTAIYKSSYNTDGYNLAKNSKSISYSKATKPSTLATVKGATSKSGLSVSGKKITLKSSALKNKVTVSGSYEFDFASDYKQATITGSSKADTITARGTKVSVNGGKGDDKIKILGSGTVSGGAGADIFYYKSSGSNLIADYAAEDKISIASGTAVTSTSGDDLILTVGKGKISVTGGAKETVTYFDADGKHTYKKSSDGIKYNAKKTSATLLSSYDSDSFTFDAGLKSLDATKVEQDLIIIGNKKANTITGSSQKDTIDGGAGTDDIKGGKGNDSIFGGTGDDTLYGGEGRDTLWGGKDDDYLVGGAGNDVFLYTPGDGIDRISDYDFQHDTIKLLTGSVDNKETAGEDIVFTVGDGKIIVEKVTYAVIIDGSGTQIPYRSPTKS